MLIVFRFLEGMVAPKPGDLVGLDPDRGPVLIYLSEDDRRAVKKMPETATSIMMCPDAMPKETADALLRLHVPSDDRKITHLFPFQGESDGRAEAQPGL